MPVSAEALTLQVGDRLLLRDWTHWFAARSLTAVVGPSGAGKSTLLLALAGFRTPSSGTVQVTSQGDGLARIAYVSQAPTLFMERTALDNVALGCVSVGEEMEEARNSAQELLSLVGLEAAASARTHLLSGGERQRVMIARSLAMRSDVLLADEPTASLDPRNRDLVCQALSAAALSGVTTIVATHDSFVASLADVTVSPWVT